MSTLYEITDEYMQLLAMAEDPDIDEEALRDTMEGIEGELEIKADNYARVMKELDAKADAINKEVERLKARADAITNNSKRIKNALESAMIITGKTKFKTDLFSFGIQKNAPALKYDHDIDASTLPERFQKVTPVMVNTTAVKEALKNGEELGWAYLEQGQSLRIR